MHDQPMSRRRWNAVQVGLGAAAAVLFGLYGCVATMQPRSGLAPAGWRLTAATDPDQNPAAFANLVGDLGWGDGHTSQRRCEQCAPQARVPVKIDAAPGLASYDPRQYAGRAVLGRFQHLGNPGAPTEQMFGVRPGSPSAPALFYLVTNAIDANGYVTYNIYQIQGSTVTRTNRTGWMRLCHVDHNYGDRKRAKFMDCAHPASSSATGPILGGSDYDVRFQSGAEAGWWECAGAGCCTTSATSIQFNSPL